MSDAFRASLRLPGALESLRAQDVRASAQARIFERGVTYHRNGRVRGVNLEGTRLNAWVDGHRSRPYLVECVDTGKGSLRANCSCPYAQDWRLPCKHLVAALLAWIAQRRHIRRGTAQTTSAQRGRPRVTSHHLQDKEPAVGFHGAAFRQAPAGELPQAPVARVRLRPFPRSLPSWMATRLELSERGLLSEPRLSLPMAWMFVTEFFSGAGMLRGEVTVSEDGTTLEVAVRAEQTGLEARYRIPREEIPNFVAHCRRASDLKWVGPAAELTLRRQPVSPCLVADFDEAGRLVLEPKYALPERIPDGPALLNPQELEAGRVDEQWFWGRHGLSAIAPVPRRLRPYFSGEAPLSYKGMRIPGFLAGEYHRLLQEISFRPSETVRQARILPPPVVGHVKVDVDGPDWLWCDLRYVSGNHWLALREVLEAHAKGSYLRRGHEWIPLPGRAELLEAFDGVAPDGNGRMRLSRLQYLRARASWDPARVRLEESKQARRFWELLERIVPPPEPPPLGEGMTALRPYQQAGYQWLWFLHVNGFHGVLADEMGLGKTHQAMALLHAAWASDGAGQRPSLVVCPTTVLEHWEDKLRRHAPSLRFLRLHGLERLRSFEGVELPPVVLTTYALLAREAALFESVEWDYVVLDEAQKIKNSATKMARAAKRLRAAHRLALTGTPLENRPMELWSLFEFLVPGYLGSARAFRQRFEVPVAQRGDVHAAERLRLLVHPFKLRRCKADVLKELPPKVEDIRWCELTAHQAALYRATLRQQAGALVERLRDCSRPVAYIHIFAALTRLKRICDHPALVLSGRRAHALGSGKFTVFQELMEEALEEGQKVVVFSQYLEMLDVIAAWLSRKRIGHVHLRGATRHRGKVIDTFQREPSCRVFLGSLLAGGLGIDLTAASIVIHYDRWWNAAREDQATDRVHRIGQSRGVQVFKLVSKGTLEERIHRMIERKRAMMNALVASDADSLKTFTREDLIELLTAEPGSSAVASTSACALRADAPVPSPIVPSTRSSGRRRRASLLPIA